MPSIAARRRPLIAALVALSVTSGVAHGAEWRNARSTQIPVDGGLVEVNVHAGRYSVSAEAINDWVTRSAHAVSTYLGRFPVELLRLEIRSEAGDDVGFGMAYGHDHHIEVDLGHRANANALMTDWVLVHEMLHMGHPDVGDRHKWFKEGLATYVEPIARAQIGNQTAEQVWNGFRTQLPQGQPQPGDRGLDFTPTWGRIYWGGALYFFVSDIAIRQQTGNRKGLQDALRAILRAGGTLDRDWSIQKTLAIGDAATGTTVLQDQYQRMRARPVRVDLERIWQQLGVSSEAAPGPQVDEKAPLAAIRTAILTPPDPPVKTGGAAD